MKGTRKLIKSWPKATEKTRCSYYYNIVGKDESQCHDFPDLKFVSSYYRYPAKKRLTPDLFIFKGNNCIWTLRQAPMQL